MSQQSQLVRNTLILAIGKLSTQIVSFILLPVYTIFLSPEQFGVVDLIISYTVLLAPLIMFQLDRAAFRLLIESRGDFKRTRVVISNTMRMVLTSLALVLVAFVILNIFVSIPYGLLIASAITASIFSALFLQFARGLGKNVSFASASIITAATNLTLSVCFVVLLGFGVQGVLWATIAANLIAAGYLFVNLQLNKYISFSSESNNANIRKELITFSWPLVPSAISWWFIRTFDRTLITIILGAAANGIYAATSRYALIFNALYSIFDMSWTESASSHIDSKNRDKFFSDVYNASFRFFASLGLMMIAVTPFIFDIIIGEQFREAYLYIPVLLVGTLFTAAFSQYNAVYIAKMKTKEVLVSSVTAAVVSVTLNIILIPTIGILGAAISSAVAFFIMSVWRHYDIKKYVNITFTGNIFVKLVLAYALTISLYYVDSVYANIINLIVTTIVALLLSKTMVQGGFRKTIAKINGLKIRRH